MGRSVPSAARWRAMGRPAAEPAEPPDPASSRNYCTARRLLCPARASDEVRSRDKRRGGLAAPCVGVAFQKVGNEAKFSFVRIFPANSRALCKTYCPMFRAGAEVRVINYDCGHFRE
jgi:hypothetical protein